MTVREARATDLTYIMSLIDEAREYFRCAMIPQWQGEYPSRELIADDIARGEFYVCEESGSIMGACAIVSGVERDYINIYEGSWKNDRDYISVHRIAVGARYKGKGVAASLIDRAVARARECGVRDIRCDTHRDNLSMRRMLEKNGFENRGIIYLSEDGAERVAYQMTLD